MRATTEPNEDIPRLDTATNELAGTAAIETLTPDENDERDDDGEVDVDDAANAAATTATKKKKKKKAKKSSKAKAAASEPAKAAEPAKTAGNGVLCISRNKHWRYISSYHVRFSRDSYRLISRF
jgi:hypothetical protein